MLIMTSQATQDPLSLLDSSGWRGPGVFVILPTHRRTKRELLELEDRMFVFEWLTPPVSGIELLATVTGQLGPLLSSAAWPLYYASSPILTQEVAEAWLVGQGERRVIHTDEQTGKLDRVLLGPDIVSHPMVHDFFRILRDLGAEDAQFLPLIRVSLARSLH